VRQRPPGDGSCFGRLARSVSLNTDAKLAKDMPPNFLEALSPTASSLHPRGNYAALDGLRGFAVLLVFCVHAAGNAASVFLYLSFSTFRSLSSSGDRLLFWINRSHHGVYLFFVLSGFLIGRMWWPKPVMPYRVFIWRRTLRIYPAFLVAFAASLVFSYISGDWHLPDWPRVIGNLLFLNGLPGVRVEPFNSVTWSLFYEMVFYLAFPLLVICLQRFSPAQVRLLPLLGIGLPAIAVSAGADSLHLCWSLLFCGVAAALYEAPLRVCTNRIPTSLVVLAYLAVTTVGVFDVLPATPVVLAFGAVAVLVLGKCIANDSNAVSAMLKLRPIVALGRVSYSFYLMHFMIVVLVALALGQERDQLGPVTGTVLLFTVGFALSVIAATIVWWLAERPYFVWTRRL
jgi:exopolysaccharide production protein ExoZ